MSDADQTNPNTVESTSTAGIDYHSLSPEEIARRKPAIKKQVIKQQSPVVLGGPPLMTLIGVFAYFIQTGNDRFSLMSFVVGGLLFGFLTSILLLVMIPKHVIAMAEHDAMEQFITENNFTKIDKNYAEQQSGLIFRMMTGNKYTYGFGLDNNNRLVVLMSYSGMMPRSYVSRGINTVFSSKNTDPVAQKYSSYEYKVVVCQLGVSLPNVIIDSKTNDGGDGPMGQKNLIDRWVLESQKLQLEGDFNKYFDVYVPKNLEQEVLYFLTPELMHNLIQHGTGFDFEVAGNALYIFQKYAAKISEKNVRQLVEIGQYFQTEFRENTKRYRNSGSNQQNEYLEQSNLRKIV